MHEIVNLFARYRIYKRFAVDFDLASQVSLIYAIDLFHSSVSEIFLTISRSYGNEIDVIFVHVYFFSTSYLLLVAKNSESLQIYDRVCKCCSSVMNFTV